MCLVGIAAASVLGHRDFDGPLQRLVRLGVKIPDRRLEKGSLVHSGTDLPDPGGRERQRRVHLPLLFPSGACGSQKQDRETY